MISQLYIKSLIQDFLMKIKSTEYPIDPQNQEAFQYMEHLLYYISETTFIMMNTPPSGQPGSAFPLTKMYSEPNIMFFRGRAALSVVRTLTNTGPSLEGLTTIVDRFFTRSTRTEEIVQRQQFRNTFIMLAQTGGILFMCNVIITGLRRL